MVVSNLKVGDNLNPVSVVVFDNDAMEGLNLPNNLKASAAKRMEQGLVQNIDMPLSSIGTMASEVTSVVNATTQVAKQILNMSLSQVKVHLKSNYEMYIQEESQESKLRRQAVQAELQKLYEQMEQEKRTRKSSPSNIDRQIMIDILNYLLALSAVFFGYRIYVSRRNGRAFKEIRPLTVSFGITLLLLWGITVFTAFFKNRLTYRQHEEIYLSTVYCFVCSLPLFAQETALPGNKPSAKKTSLSLSTV